MRADSHIFAGMYIIGQNEARRREGVLSVTVKRGNRAILPMAIAFCAGAAAGGFAPTPLTVILCAAALCVGLKSQS